MRSYFDGTECESYDRLIKYRDDLWKEYCFAREFSQKVGSKEGRKHYYTLLSQISDALKEVELRIQEESVREGIAT